MLNKKTSFLKGAAILGLAGLLVKVIGAVFRIPLQNTIGVEGMASYEVAYPVYSLLLVISSSGLPIAISKLVSERVAVGNYHGAFGVFKISLWMLTFIGLLSGTALFALSTVYADMSGIPNSGMAIAGIAPALFFVPVLCAYRGYFQGMQNMSATAFSQVIEQLGKLILGLVMAKKYLHLGPGYAAMGATLGIALSEFIALVVLIILYFRKRRSFQDLIRRSTNRCSEGWYNTAKQLFCIAVPVTLGASIMPLTGVVDSLTIVNSMKSLGFSQNTAQSAYSIFRSIVSPIINLPGVLTVALAMSIVPAISADMAQKAYSGVSRASSTALKLSLLIGLPCTVGLFVMAEPIIKILFSSLTQGQLELATALLKTASIGVVFLSVVQTMTGILQGIGKMKIPVSNLAIGAVLKIISLIILMHFPQINIQGAAISTVICYAVAGVLDAIQVIRLTKLQITYLDILVKPVIISLIMGLLINCVYPPLVAAAGATMGAIAAMLAGGGAYVILTLLSRILNKDDLELIPGAKLLGLRE